MKPIFVFAALLFTLNLPAFASSDQDQYFVEEYNAQNQAIDFSYDDVLIVSGPEGVAAFAFGEIIEDGVKYRSRFLPKLEAKEVLDEGEVFEKYTFTPLSEPNRFLATDVGSQLHLKAGQIAYQWSGHGKYGGWLYYNPKTTKVTIVADQALETLDLKAYQ